MFLRVRSALVFAVLLSCVGMRAQTAPSSASVQDDSVVTALVVKIYGQMRAGTVDRTLLTPEMAASLTPDVQAQMKEGFTQLGEPTKVTLQTKTVVDVGTNYLYSAVFAIGEVRITILVNHEGKVAGYRLMI
jgi:hypothetical protein